MTITRTINTTKIKANIYDISRAEMSEKYFTISGKHTDRDSVVEKHFKEWEKENKSFRVLNILESVVESGLYAMDENVFLKYAERIGDGRESKKGEG